MILVTGFTVYGGRGANPAEMVARALDGATIGGARVAAEILPIDFGALRTLIPALIDRHAPRAMIMLGLWPGEAVIRLERVAANRAQFEIPDATGHLANAEVVAGGPGGYLSTLPADRIEAAVRAAGIPCRQSGTAGSYLCNATLYLALHHAARHRPGMRAGFIHLPYLPAQVAQMLDDLATEARTELHQRADLASMDPGLMRQAVEIAIATTIKAEDRG
ncbi:MAG: hypothetical protein ACO38S_06750 [Gemmobacter sp.]